MANHGHDITMATRPDAQHAKTVFSIVVGYSLDEAGQNFLGRLLQGALICIANSCVLS